MNSIKQQHKITMYVMMAVTVVVLSIGYATQVAALSLLVDDQNTGGSDVIVNDNNIPAPGVGPNTPDIDPNLGIVAYNTSVIRGLLPAFWTFQSDIGISKPILPISATGFAEMHLDNVSININQPGQLLIGLTDYNFQGGRTVFGTGLLGGASTGDVTVQAWLDINLDNLPAPFPGFGDVTDVSPVVGPGAFSTTLKTPEITALNPYSMTMWAMITFNTPGQISFNYIAKTDPIPEPTTLLLLGLGLVGMGTLARRKMRG